MNRTIASAGVCLVLGALLFVGLAWAQQDNENQAQTQDTTNLKVYTFVHTGETTSRIYEDVHSYSIIDGVLRIMYNEKAVALSPHYWAKVEQTL
jgi:hypothetical protein